MILADMELKSVRIVGRPIEHMLFYTANEAHTNGVLDSLFFRLPQLCESGDNYARDKIEDTSGDGEEG